MKAEGKIDEIYDVSEKSEEIQQVPFFAAVS